VAQIAGVPLTPEPSLPAYTGEPSPWNTFTALYAPTVDFGVWIAPLLLMVLGFAFGLLWSKRASDMALLTYACLAPGILYSTVANSLVRPHLIGAALLACTTLLLSRQGMRFVSERFALASR
jgi:hypothetical protein